MIPAFPDPHVRETPLGPAPPRYPLLCILHQGTHYAIIEKPAGSYSVPGRGEDKHDSIEVRAKARFADLDYVGMPHRLDVETSGLIIVALSRWGHGVFTRQFTRRQIGKTYVALLDGLVEDDEGEVHLPIGFDFENRPRQRVDHEQGRKATTLFRVLERDESRRLTRVLFRPKTGRTHQLRVHASTPRDLGGLGCPILGDTLYGDASNAPRLMLHANHIAFWEPGGDGVWVKYTSDSPF